MIHNTKYGPLISANEVALLFDGPVDEIKRFVATTDASEETATAVEFPVDLDQVG
jgi:hypothetical protein